VGGVSVGGDNVGITLGVLVGGADVGISAGVGVLTRVGTVCRSGDCPGLAHTFLLFDTRTIDRRRNVIMTTFNRNCCIPPSPIGQFLSARESP
jgi:hypothetical protein